jgi:hypothetical protein
MSKPEGYMAFDAGGLRAGRPTLHRFVKIADSITYSCWLAFIIYVRGRPIGPLVYKMVEITYIYVNLFLIRDGDNFNILALEEFTCR